MPKPEPRNPLAGRRSYLDRATEQAGPPEEPPIQSLSFPDPTPTLAPDPAAPPVQEAGETPPAPPYWRRTSLQFREEQMAWLDQFRARTWADSGIRYTQDEIIRVALDEFRKVAERDPQALAGLLARQQAREIGEKPERKFSRSTKR